MLSSRFLSARPDGALEAEAIAQHEHGGQPLRGAVRRHLERGGTRHGDEHRPRLLQARSHHPRYDGALEASTKSPIRDVGYRDT